jgi:hypothetical protein
MVSAAEPGTAARTRGVAMGSQAAREPKREWRIKKVARLAVYSIAVTLGLGLVAARSVYGDVKQTALSMGHELGQLGDVGTKRPLRINGEPIFIASSVEDLSVKEILDRTEARCKQASAGMAADLENLSSTLKQTVEKQVGESKAAGILREDRDQSGVVACLIRDEGEPVNGMNGVTSRLAEMVKTGNLGALGRLRYVFAEKTDKGRTHVVAAWTEGPFNLYALMPGAGKDAPGSDSTLVARPPRSQRILSADVEGVPYAVRIYDSAATPDEIVKMYDEEMPKKGWEPTYGVAGEGPDQRAFMRPGSDVMIVTSRDGGRTLVSVIELQSK